MSAPTDGQKSWFDEPKNISLIVWLLVLACVGTMVGYEIYEEAERASFEAAQLEHYPESKEEYVRYHYHSIEVLLPGFYGWFGFIAYSSIISGAVLLRKIVMRSEDYYDE